MSLDKEVLAWYYENEDWIDRAWQDYYFSRGGSKSAADFDCADDDFITDLYVKYNEEKN